MKIKYLDQYWHYKPEYDIAEFVRINCIEEYRPQTIIKIMKALYPLWIQENRPEFCED